MPLRIVVNHGRNFLVHPEQDRPMAGVQSAALALCYTLARRGHDVHLFGRCPNPGRHGGVTFHERGEFARFAATQHADVLVAIPEVLPLLMPLRARARVVWSGNAYRTGDCAISVPWPREHNKSTRLYSMALFDPSFDHLVVGSRWQAGHLRDGLDGKTTVMYLGVHLEYYRRPAPARHRFRLVYASQARRGLRPLLRFFPAVRAAVPEAELHVFVNKDTAVRTLPDREDVDQPGVYWRERVTKSALVHELRSAAVMAYPSRFSETFCLAVAEAQAAGLPVVTSDRAALPERVSHGVDGFLIPGEPDDAGYEAAFVEAVVRLLRDDGLWTRMGAEAEKKAWRLYDWDSIASAWEDLLGSLVAGKEPAPPPIDPMLDLLEPSLLTNSRSSGADADIPPGRAKQWLQEAWASYGYTPSNIPGLPDD
jgi:glycosyltransferase involved in cell wall biosynthesis